MVLELKLAGGPSNPNSTEWKRIERYAEERMRLLLMAARVDGSMWLRAMKAKRGSAHSKGVSKPRPLPERHCISFTIQPYGGDTCWEWYLQPSRERFRGPELMDLARLLERKLEELERPMESGKETAVEVEVIQPASVEILSPSQPSVPAATARGNALSQIMKDRDSLCLILGTLYDKMQERSGSGLATALAHDCVRKVLHSSQLHNNSLGPVFMILVQRGFLHRGDDTHYRLTQQGYAFLRECDYIKKDESHTGGRTEVEETVTISRRVVTHEPSHDLPVLQFRQLREMSLVYSRAVAEKIQVTAELNANGAKISEHEQILETLRANEHELNRRMHVARNVLENPDFQHAHEQYQAIRLEIQKDQLQ